MELGPYTRATKTLCATDNPKHYRRNYLCFSRLGPKRRIVIPKRGLLPSTYMKFCKVPISRRFDLLLHIQVTIVLYSVMFAWESENPAQPWRSRRGASEWRPFNSATFLCLKPTRPCVGDTRLQLRRVNPSSSTSKTVVAVIVITCGCDSTPVVPSIPLLARSATRYDRRAVLLLISPR